MNCKYCGTHNRTFKTFCAKCGGNLYVKAVDTRKRTGLLNHLLLEAAARNPSPEQRHLYL